MTVGNTQSGTVQGEMIEDINESNVDLSEDTTAMFLKQYDCWHLYKYFIHLRLDLGIFV